MGRQIMDIYSQVGSKIEFLGKNGQTWELSKALELLEANQTYTVKSIDVGSWCSYVTLKELPSITFNTVMFNNLYLE